MSDTENKKRFYVAPITMNWGMFNSVIVGMVSFDNDILQDVVYDKDLMANVLMYLQGRPGMMDACEEFIRQIVVSCGTQTRAQWDHYHISNHGGYMQHGKSNLIAMNIDKVELERIFRQYIK